MKKAKWHALAMIAGAMALVFGSFAGCSNDGGGGNGGGQSDPNVGGGSTVQEQSITMNGTSYETIGAAIAAIPQSGTTDTYTIVLGKGTYDEVGLSYDGSATIKISGETNTKYGADVIIKGQGSDQDSSKTRPLLEVQGTGDLILENVTFESTFTRASVTHNNTQAEVIGFDSRGNLAAYNCSFLSHQDTLRTTGKAWFYGCYVEGDVDFMWCESSSKVALYENCEIKAVGDEADAAYIAAPRVSRATKIWKGLVVFNSKVISENDTYLFRNPWNVNETIYNNAAFIDVEVTGNLNAALAKYAANGTSDQKYIGWKIDQTLADVYTSKLDSIGVVDAELEAAEYAGRNNIVNRCYDTVLSKFMKDTESNWNLAEVADDNGWTVSEDTSKDSLDGEVEIVTNVYTFDSETVEGVTCDGFALESGKTHYRGANGNTITIPVTGKCVVTVAGYYAGNGTIKAGEQGEVVYDFNNGSTNSFVEKNYIVYDENATSVVITATATSYITKVTVAYDSTIEYVPVTAIAVTGDSENYTVGVVLNLSAEVTPANATNKDVKWTSSDETVGTVDQYSGKVTFNKAGSVTFTATALDGSSVSSSITCEATAATWTVAEWYTIDNDVTTVEEGSTEMGIFTTGSSVYKSLGATVEFTNLAGQKVSTLSGFKLNSSGKLSFSTIKESTLTVVVYTGTGTAAKPGVNGQTTAKNSVSDVGEPIVDETAKLKTYVYRLSSGDTYTIDRSPTTSEINPIVYVKVEYDAVWSWKETIPSTIVGTNIQGATGTVASNIDGVALDVDATCQNGKLDYNASGYCQFNQGTIIKVPVKNVGSVVTAVSYPDQSKYTVGATQEDTATDTDSHTVTADDVTVGYVAITATGGAYIYSITLTNPL